MSSNTDPSNKPSHANSFPDELNASYEGTGGFVKGVVSVLTEIVNAVMARGTQVCER